VKLPFSKLLSTLKVIIDFANQSLSLSRICANCQLNLSETN